MAPNDKVSVLDPTLAEDSERPTRKRSRSQTNESKESEDVSVSVNLVQKYHIGEDSRVYEYSSYCNPTVPTIPTLCHPPELHESGPTRVIPFNLSRELRLPYTATSQNLLASFLKICPNESLQTEAVATSQCFYIIRGNGHTESEFENIAWNEGDLFVLPASSQPCNHVGTTDAALYWVSDEPLMKYLGVQPNEMKFKPTMFRKDDLISQVEVLREKEDAEHQNRLGILLGNKATEETTKTLTHVLWALLNVIPPNVSQKPHRHNSVALDLCISAATEGVYTLMGPELNEDGTVKDPIRMDWKTGGAFTTPPGWWHSHHNESASDAWVLPLQDAGILTHQGVLDIQFSERTEAELPAPQKTKQFAGADSKQQKQSRKKKAPTKSAKKSKGGGRARKPKTHNQVK